MIVYGYVKDYMYTNDGTFQVQIRIPSIHGPYKQGQSKGTYTRDADLPWYTSVLLPHLPLAGEVAMLQSINESKSSDYVVIGLTGGSYSAGATIS